MAQVGQLDFKRFIETRKGPAPGPEDEAASYRRLSLWWDAIAYPLPPRPLPAGDLAVDCGGEQQPAQADERHQSEGND